MDAQLKVYKYFVTPFLVVCTILLSGLTIYKYMEESYVSINMGDEFYSWANDNMLQVKTWPNFSKDDVKQIADFSFVPQGESKEILGNKPKPAASVCVVKDGDIVFKAGYGSTSVDKDIPVDPDKTIFKVASVSKVFTALAIIKLAEEDKLDLQEDINKYLKKTGIIIPDYPVGSNIEPETRELVLKYLSDNKSKENAPEINLSETSKIQIRIVHGAEDKWEGFFKHDLLEIYNKVAKSDGRAALQTTASQTSKQTIVEFINKDFPDQWIVFEEEKGSKDTPSPTESRIVARVIKTRNGYEYIENRQTVRPTPYITLAQLLTHTPGLEKKLTTILTKSADKITTLPEYFKQNPPNHIMGSGKLYDYSNYGTALAGLIIEEVSGMPFEEYVKKNVFEKLGMSYTTFEQPIPDELQKNYAKPREWKSEGYYDTKNEFKEFDPYYFNDPPADAMVTTAGDVGKFLTDLFKQERFFSEDSACLFTNIAFEQDAVFYPKHTLAFEVTQHDCKEPFLVLDKQGGALGVGSRLVILPKQKIGLFATEAGSNACHGFINQLLQKIWPPASEDDTSSKDEQNAKVEEPSRYTGYYSNMWYVQKNSFAKLGILVFHDLYHFTYNKDGYISINDWEYVPAGKDLFKSKLGDSYIKFVADGNNQISHAQIWGQALERIDWLANPTPNLVFIIIFLLTILSTIVSFIFGALFRKFDKTKQTKFDKLARWSQLVTALLYVSFLVVVAIIFWGTNMIDYGFGIPLYIKATALLPMIGALMAVTLVYFTVMIWVKKYWSMASRIFYTVATFVYVLVIPWMIYWNLFSFIAA